MASKKRSSRRRGETPANGGARNSEPGDPAARRPLWVRILAIFVLVGLVVTLVLTNRKEPRPQTAIALEAEESTPEIAALLREIDDVACTIVERFPESPEAMDVLARAHYRLGKQQAAEEYWHRCVELDSDFCPAIHSIGLQNLEIGNHAKAVEYFRKALELQPASPAFSVELAQALLANGQTQDAIDVLEKDVQLHPKALATLAMLGQAYLQDRQYAKAKHFFERAIVVGPSYSNAYNGLVTACANLGEEEKAKEYAETLTKIRADEMEIHKGMLQEHDDIGKIEGILGEIYMAAANVYLTQNEPGIAEKYLLRAIERVPNFVAAHEVLTWLYQRQGRERDAVKTLDDLLAIAPDDDVAAQMGCAELCSEMGRFDAAESAYQTAIELTPEQAGGFAALAWLYIEHLEKLPENEKSAAKRLASEAKRLAQEAVQREPLAKHYYLLGVACQINDDQEGARTAISRALTLDPRNREYQRVWKILSVPEQGS